MPELEHSDFPHRKNDSTSFDSICPTCFRTVSNQENERDLKAYENAHVCDRGEMIQRDTEPAG